MTAATRATEVELDASWGILGRLHGGYLLATMVRESLAAGEPDLHPHPLATAATYLTPPAAGPATVVVEPLRVGRSVASYRVVLTQDGHDCVQALVTLGTLPAADAMPRWSSATAGAPPVAALDDCIPPPQPKGTDRRPGVMNHVDMRFDPTSVGWDRGEATGNADYHGWLRMITDWNPVLAQFILADAPPPVTFDLGLIGWVPTLQLQVLLRRLPPPAGHWQQVRQFGLTVNGGLLDEDCNIWDDRGRLTVQARQLAAYRENSA